ncbi:MAG TPA: sulfite exporter TauE/SafE family protein [Capsulimonadaceae bacterium]|nr:sulfite exporter TauE/SafE family protein [Capsulimonadaceae bacterium]
MTPTLLKDAALFAAAFAGGAINSVAGGGTLITFPALVWAGVPWVSANATSTVALVPGSASAFWGYRDELEKSASPLLWLGIPSILGGGVGALLVLKAGDKLFAHLVPWLILGATVLFMIQGPISAWMRRRADQSTASDTQPPSAPKTTHLLGLMLFQFVVAIYGGFFGAGIGILMLAALGLLGLTNIHRMNGLKNMAAICINSVASLTFIAGHRVHWVLALVMAAGAVCGGYGGAGLARKMGQKTVRRVVIGIGLVIATIMFLRQV